MELVIILSLNLIQSHSKNTLISLKLTEWGDSLTIGAVLLLDGIWSHNLQMFLFLMIKLMQRYCKGDYRKIRTIIPHQIIFYVCLSMCIDEFNAGLTLMEAKFLQHQKLAIITIIGQPLPLLLIIIMQKRSMLLSLAVNIQQLLNNNAIPPNYY